MRKTNRRIFLGIGYIGPALFIVGLISFFPMAYAIYVSLHKTFYLRIDSFIGLTNYLTLFRSPEVLNSMRVTTIYVFGSLALALPLGLTLALLLNRSSRSVNVFRLTTLLPWVLSQTTVGLLWTWVLNTSYGPVNYVLLKWGVGKINFFGEDVALLSVIAINVWWSFPLPTLFLLAALQNIPKNLYEVAKIDGASSIGCFTHITLPFLSNTLLVLLIVQTMQYVNMVTLIFVLTGGGPAGATETFSFRIFFESLFNMRIGLASALSVVLFAFNLVFAGLYVILLRRETPY